MMSDDFYSKGSIFKRLEDADPRDSRKNGVLAFKSPMDGDRVEKFPPTVPKPKGYPLTFLKEMLVESAAKSWVFKGLIAHDENSEWFGPPGSLKSSLLTEMGVHAAAGMDWRGFRSKGACGVIYIALERADLTKRRIRAHVARLGLPDTLPIAVVGASVILNRPGSHKAVEDTIEEAERVWGVPVGLIIFDTFSALIAAGGGNEDKAQDQGIIYSQIQEVKWFRKLHVAIVGHTGKDESRGKSGSNQGKRITDMEVQLSGKPIRTAEIIKRNDGEEGPLFSFTHAIHEFGLDEDGEPITVSIVSDEVVEAPAEPKREDKLPANQRTLFMILADAGASGLHAEEWTAKAKDAGIGVRRRGDITEARLGLKSKGLVREFADRWHVNHSS
jgi:hypothetical protein